jgi:aspartate aminotransferase
MSTDFISKRSQAATASVAALEEFYFRSRYGVGRGSREICDFTFGNPHEFPLPGIVDVIQSRAVPENKDWYAYKTNEPEPQAFLAEKVGAELDLDFQPQDIALTNGAFGAIAVTFRMLLNPGDETIFSIPSWFSYEPMLLADEAVPKKVALKGDGFDLDLEAIEAAITPKTRLVIVNTPHNPTGRIYDADTLTALAELLERASARIGKRIFLLSDEPYRRIRFDGNDFTSPATIYPWTLISYSYGKVLLAPGQRLGYLAISPLMPRAEREALQRNVFATQMSIGWCFPSALMQHAIPDLESLSIDIDALTRKRDLLIGALEPAGYKVLRPGGTFYLFCKCPGDEMTIWNALADRDVFVLPGQVMEAPGNFRICLTASQSMVERALPAFAEVTGDVNQPAA